MASIHGGHRQRLKERVLREGLEGFNPHQIIELLLFNVIPRGDTDEIAHELIDRFKSVDGVLHAGKDELLSVKGIGERAAEYLCRVSALVDSYSALRFDDRETLSNASMIRQYAQKLSMEHSVNSVWQLCLSPRGVLQTCAKVCDGLQWGEAECLRRCVLDMAAVRARNAVIVILSPYEMPDEDGYDAATAQNYGYMLSTMEAELLDVLVVRPGSIVSLNRLGSYDRHRLCAARSVLSEQYDDDEPDEP